MTGDARPHLRDIPIAGLAEHLENAGCRVGPGQLRRLALGLHRHGDGRQGMPPIKRRVREGIRTAFDDAPLLTRDEVVEAEDRTRKLLLRTRDGHGVEAVLLRNAKARTICLSSQAGCALGCTFCATGTLGLQRHLTPGEITESFLHAQDISEGRISDVVFMGQGEPLHNLDAVLQACDVLAHDLGPQISRRRITVSTVGLIPGIQRFTKERLPWRLNVSLHSAVQATRERLVPIAREHPVAALMASLRAYQAVSPYRWITLQYVALPDVNLDDAHVDALGRALEGLRAIVNVIPWNDTGAGYRSPSWAEVKDFTTRLRRLGCPVKIRYSGGKQEGMGCGQLAAERALRPAPEGHMAAPPGIFTG